MKIELVKKTTAIYGDTYYFVKVDGFTEGKTWTTDKEAAEKSFIDICEKAKQFPKDVYETLRINESDLVQ